MPAETADCGAVSGAADGAAVGTAGVIGAAGCWALDVGSSTQADVFVQSAQIVGVPPVDHFIDAVPVPSGL